MAKKLPKRKTYHQLLNMVKTLQNQNKILAQKQAYAYKKNYNCCQKNIYLNYDKSQHHQNIKKHRDISLSNYLQSLNMKISNIQKKRNTSKNKADKCAYKIIKNKIGNKLDSQQFMDGVDKSIEIISKTWPKNQIITLKEELKQFDFSKFDFDKDCPLSNLKKDSFLDLLLSKGMQFNADNIDLKNLGIKNCAKSPLTTGIHFFDPNSGTNKVFNKQFILKKITTNIGIVNAYYKMIQKFTQVKNMKYNHLIAYLEDIVLNTNIYFCDLPKDVCGVTISNGDIYIAGDYLSEALGETNDFKCLTNQDDKIYYRFTAIGKIYLTLLHEYSHKLHYVIREKYSQEEWEENFCDHSEMINSEENLDYFYDLGNISKVATIIPVNCNYKNIHSKKDSNENGNFFDKELYLGKHLKELNHDICDFYLSKRCSNYSSYINTLLKLKSGANKPGSRLDSNSVFKIKSNLKGSSCYFSVKRNCN